MKPARVLLVEDNAVTRRLVQFALRGDDIQLLEATRGSEALPLALSSRPHLVLLDIVLPDTTGFEVLETLRPVVGPRVPILAFTGLLAPANEGRLVTSGFDDVIAKPIEPVRLREILRGYLPGPTQIASFGDNRRILIVDDDPVQRKLAAFRLSRLGFEVATAADGEEALALAHRRVPDAVISDVLMPRVDGFELCSRLRADETFARTAILLLTNSVLEESDRALAVQVGADAYLARTPELQELTDALREILAGAERRSLPQFTFEPEAHSERTARTIRLLDRQLALHASFAQRAAMLSAELAILGGLTGALAENRDVDAALNTALSACFDASGISWGLLLVRDGASWVCQGIGLSDDEVRRLDGPRIADRLRLGGDVRSPYSVRVSDVFGLPTEGTALLTPIVHREEQLGAIVFATGGTLDDHHIAFAGVVAGQIALVLALARSFRELERATEAERARVRVLESTLNAIADPIVVVDQGSRPLHWNRAASPLVQSMSEVLSEQWPAHLGLHHADQSTLYRSEELPSRRALRGENVDDEEVLMRGSGGGGRWLSFTARPVRRDDGVAEGAVLIVRDVTESKRLQARQIASDRMASIGLLAAGVAHEVNNPLTSVLAELDMAIEDTAPTHPAMERLRVARDGAERVRLIVHDLKTLSRGDSDEVAPVDLHRVVDTAVRMAAAQTRPCAVVECEFQPVAPVEANESRLVQVVLNLLVNAAQAIGTASPSTHRIRLRVAPGGEREALIEVSDTGPGMSAGVRSRLFTPFFTTKPVGMGTGLGLSICHRIMTAIGGQIDCMSAPGQGTTFRLRMPTLLDRFSSRPVPALREPASALRLVAVVEDPLLRQVVMRGLRPRFDVEVTRSADEALERLATGAAPALVLCEVGVRTPEGEPLDERLARAGLAVALLGGSRASGEATRPLLPRPFDGRALHAFVLEMLNHQGEGS